MLKLLRSIKRNAFLHGKIAWIIALVLIPNHDLLGQRKYTEKEVKRIIDQCELFMFNDVDSLNYRNVIPLVQIIDQLKDPDERARASYILAHYYNSLYDTKTAIKYYKISASTYKDLGKVGLYINSIKDLCNAYRMSNRQDLVEDVLKESIVYATNNNAGFYILDPIMELCVHFSYSMADYQRGAYYGEMFFDTLAKYRNLKIQDRNFHFSQTTDAAIIDLELGHCFVELRNYEKARFHLNLAHSFFSHQRDKEKLSRVYAHLLRLNLYESGSDQSAVLLDSMIDNIKKFEIGIYKNLNLNPVYMQELNSLREQQIVQNARIESLKQEEKYTLGIAIGTIVFSLVSVFYFIRRRKDQIEINDLLRTKVKMEQARSEQKTKYLAIISHELRTPIYSISGLSKLLIFPEHNTKENIESIINSGDHLLHLVNNVLQHNHIEDGEKVSLDLSEFNLKEVILSARQIIAFIASQKQISVSVITQNLPGEHWVRGDRQKLLQIIINLISNAVRFSHLQGKLEVEVALVKTEKQFNRYLFSVKDDGMGIEPERIPTIFNFKETRYNGGEEEKPNYAGLGIGLYIVSRFLEEMEGEMHVESELGKGSRFYFYLNLEAIRKTSS